MKHIYVYIKIIFTTVDNHISDIILRKKSLASNNKNLIWPLTDDKTSRPIWFLYNSIQFFCILLSNKNISFFSLL